MAKIVVDNGGELKATLGQDTPNLEVRYCSRNNHYKIIQYRDSSTSSTDQINHAYSSSVQAHAEKTRLLEEFRARKAGKQVVRTVGA